MVLLCVSISGISCCIAINLDGSNVYPSGQQLPCTYLLTRYSDSLLVCQVSELASIDAVGKSGSLQIGVRATTGNKLLVTQGSDTVPSLRQYSSTIFYKTRNFQYNNMKPKEIHSSHSKLPIYLVPISYYPHNLWCVELLILLSCEYLKCSQYQLNKSRTLAFAHENKFILRQL